MPGAYIMGRQCSLQKLVMFMTGYSRGQEGVCGRGRRGSSEDSGRARRSVGLLEELNPGVGRRDSLQTGQAVAVPSPHRHRGTVVAVSNRQAGPCLVAIDVCSGEVRVLEAGACAWSSVPVLSPDGDRVAYQGPDGRVAVLSTDGGAGSHRALSFWLRVAEVVPKANSWRGTLTASGGAVGLRRACGQDRGGLSQLDGTRRSITVIRDGRAVLVDLGDGTSVQLETVLRPQIRCGRFTGPRWVAFRVRGHSKR